jgi:hypothetical protein
VFVPANVMAFELGLPDGIYDALELAIAPASRIP